MPSRTAVALVGLLSLAVSTGAQQPSAPPITEAELLRRLSVHVDSLAAADAFSGVVLLARRGNVVFERAVGYADREAKRRNTIETRFNLGSINKVFTATAVRQLASGGRAQLDSSVSAWWPDYPNREWARAATVRQLIEMQSGIGGDIFGVPASGDRHDIRHNRDFLPLFVNEKPAFAPGTNRRYANPGYVVLGMLVERQSGEDYYAYVKQHIYDVAGMASTGHYRVDSLPPNTAIGYMRGEDAPATAPRRPNSAELPGRGSAAGGGYSTAHDLMRFMQALRERRIPGGPPPGIGAAGGTGGVNAVIEGELPGGYDLIVLSNYDPPVAEDMASIVRAWLGVKDN